MADEVWADDNWCVACGEDNPRGLHLKFRWDGDWYGTDFPPERYHQGWAGIAHGGILAILLDETMNRAVGRNGEPVATAELQVRFRRPARVGAPLHVRARLTHSRPPLYEAEGEITDADGALVATGTAKLMRVGAEA